MTNKLIGKYGEELAKDFLLKHGYKILETNYHFSKIAEIDIIATKNNILHFIEVKTRTQIFFGSPLDAINSKKLKSIYNCAIYYMQHSLKKFDKYQIDAIGIILNKQKNYDIKFIENISL